MKYKAMKRGKMNEEKDRLENKIDKIQNTSEEEEIKKLEGIKEELQELEDKKDKENARRYFAKNKSEGERPTKFFLFNEQEIEKQSTVWSPALKGNWWGWSWKNKGNNQAERNWMGSKKVLLEAV